MDILELMKSPKGYNCYNLKIPPELKKAASRLCFEYNATSPDEGEKRRELIKKLFGTAHELTFIEPTFKCDYGFNIHTHGLCVINYNCVFLDTSTIDIGANAFIAPGVCFACSGHALDAAQRAEGLGTSKPITVESDVWIGASCVICGGVTIGKGSVIGAGSVVNKDIPAGVVAAGAPCRVIREITETDRLSPEQIDL